MGPDTSGFEILLLGVPLVMLVVAVVMFVAIVRSANRRRRFDRDGQRTTGWVVESRVVRRRRTDDSPSFLRVETIEFTSPLGVVRDTPQYSDVGSLDRTGWTVTVIFDPRDPRRFTAPKNGRSASAVVPLLAGFIVVGMGVSSAGFLVFGILLIRTFGL